jgi:uncharacterized protein YtpQ (UPF0354 family)
VTLGLVVIVALALGGCSERSSDSKTELTREFIAAAKRSAPTVQIEEKGDPELRVTTSGNVSSTVFLNNCYQEWRQSPPEQRASVIQQYLEALMVPPTSKTSGIDRTRIVPIVKDKAWVHEMADSLRQRGAKKIPELVTEDINDQLCIVYAVDGEKTIAYLTPDELRESGIARAELKHVAIENLRSVLPDVSARGDNGFYMIVAGGNYEACLLLLDSIWIHPPFHVDGDIVIAVPARDLLFVTGSNDAAGLAKLRSAARKTAAESAHRLTSDLFVFRDGHFVKFD